MFNIIKWRIFKLRSVCGIVELWNCRCGCEWYLEFLSIEHNVWCLFLYTTTMPDVYQPFFFALPCFPMAEQQHMKQNQNRKQKIKRDEQKRKKENKKNTKHKWNKTLRIHRFVCVVFEKPFFGAAETEYREFTKL